MKVDWKDFDEEVNKGVDLCRKIEAYGYEAYIVGGCVRDIVLWYKGGCKGAPNIHDVDIATNMPISELYSNFKCESNNGEAHGTILVKNAGIMFEVTQFRTDGDYSDGRHPDSVQFTKSFEEDTARRDFTINAMGIDASGNLIDYHGGESDLENGVLRTVGDANSRFSEDALRIVRAMRFAARFGMRIDADTYSAIKSLHGTLDKVAMERVSAELKKTAEYGTKAFAQVIDILYDTGAYKSIDPAGLVDWELVNKLASNRAVDSLVPELKRDVTTAIVLMMAGCKDMVRFAQVFKLETDILRAAKYVYGSFDTYKDFANNLTATVKMVTDRNFDRLREIAYVCGLGDVDHSDLIAIENLVDKTGSKLKLLSKAVNDAGYKGVEFGNHLRKLTEWFYVQVLDGKMPTEEEISEFLQND